MDISRVGPYELEKEIGAGGMGTVYLGRHVETGQLAAVKVLPASLAREEGFVVRFTREIDAMKQLTNPHVVRLYESGVEGDDVYYYAMEYVEGETVTSRLRREKRIPWREAIDIAVQICSALKSAHDAGIIHRDLKPSNLLLTADGSVKLTDFGVAQVFAAGKLTATGGIIGTPEYMSPEQAQGKRATKKSDLYSLGAVLYVLLTGRPPFTGKTTLDIVQKHLYGRFDMPSRYVPDLPHWLEEIICQLLEKDPDKRPPNAYVLSRRLQEVAKKVDLTADDHTIAQDSYDGSAPTATAPTRAVSEVPSGPGEGTLMRDLLRVEIERSNASTTLGDFFNNTWVLVGSLVLLILGGVLWFEYREMPPEALFERGVALMQQPEGPAWLEAEEYFQPLLRQDPERWQDEVQPYLDQIELYALKNRLKPSGVLSRRTVPEGEAERLLLLAREYEKMGDRVRAERLLTALEPLLAGDPAYDKQHQLAQQLLESLQTQRAEKAQTDEFLARALARAEDHAQSGDPDAARAIWKGIVELYGADPAAQDSVATARRHLTKETNEAP